MSDLMTSFKSRERAEDAGGEAVEDDDGDDGGDARGSCGG